MLPKGKLFLRGMDAFFASWFRKQQQKAVTAIDLPGQYVDVDWLAQHLGAVDLRIIQMGGSQFYPLLHIPGAVLLTRSDLMGKVGDVANFRAPTQHLVALFSQLGIQANSRVVAYDSEGGMESSRLVWTLATLGHGHAAVLDGGINEWLKRALPMEKTPIYPTPVAFFATDQWQWRADWQQVFDASHDDNGPILLDTRGEKEYLGDVWKNPKGHIRRAVHLNWLDTLVDPKDPRLLPRLELLAKLRQVGIFDFDQEIITYCQSGMRAAQMWAMMRHLGFNQVRLYEGSIIDWGCRNLPLVLGPHPS